MRQWGPSLPTHLPHLDRVVPSPACARCNGSRWSASRDSDAASRPISRRDKKTRAAAPAVCFIITITLPPTYSTSNPSFNHFITMGSVGQEILQGEGSAMPAFLSTEPPADMNWQITLKDKIIAITGVSSHTTLTFNPC